MSDRKAPLIRMDIIAYLSEADIATIEAIADANMLITHDVATCLLKRGLDSLTPEEMEPHKFHDGRKKSQ